MEDGLDFFDESFFFLDHIEHSGHPGSSTTRQTTLFYPTDRNCGNPSSFYSYSRRRSGGSNRGNQQRVYFGTRLKECELHRMSTIAEMTANTEDVASDPMDESPSSGSSSDAHAVLDATPTKSVKAKSQRDRASRVSSRDPIYPFPTRVHKLSTSSRPHPALPAPKVGMRKILDYILPYPTHSLSARSASSASSQTQARRKRKRRASTISVASQQPQESRPQQERLPSEKKGKSIVAPDGMVIPRTALISLNANTASSSSSSSEESSLDEEGWIVHGFFEIQKAL
jgi:hypothetical protein